MICYSQYLVSTIFTTFSLQRGDWGCPPIVSFSTRPSCSVWPSMVQNWIGGVSWKLVTWSWNIAVQVWFIRDGFQVLVSLDLNSSTLTFFRFLIALGSELNNLAPCTWKLASLKVWIFPFPFIPFRNLNLPQKLWNLVFWFF